MLPQLLTERWLATSNNVAPEAGMPGSVTLRQEEGVKFRLL